MVARRPLSARSGGFVHFRVLSENRVQLVSQNVPMADHRAPGPAGRVPTHLFKCEHPLHISTPSNLSWSV